MANSLKMTLEFSLKDLNEKTTVVYDTKDQLVKIDGQLYPGDVKTLNALILSIRDQRDRYPSLAYQNRKNGPEHRLAGPADVGEADGRDY